jgi:hypothetical protein
MKITKALKIHQAGACMIIFCQCAPVRNATARTALSEMAARVSPEEAVELPLLDQLELCRVPQVVMRPPLLQLLAITRQVTSADHGQVLLVLTSLVYRCSLLSLLWSFRVFFAQSAAPN